MKNYISVLLCLFMVSALYAQEPKMVITMTDGSKMDYDIFDVDSMGFTKEETKLCFLYGSYYYHTYFISTETYGIKFRKTENLYQIIYKYHINNLRFLNSIDSIKFIDTFCEIDGFGFDYLIMNLNLINRGLESLPDCICYLLNLSNLNLSGNKLTGLPECFYNLYNLENLDLSSNNIKSIPKSLYNNKTLDNLVLSNNNLFELPVGMDSIPVIRNLFMNNNNLTHLGNYSFFRQLNLLDLSNNKLEGLPDSLATSNFLRFLYLSGNPLDSIPPVVFEITTLSQLFLDSTNLKTLPEDIVKLQFLNILSLANNRLSELPIKISYLKNSLTKLILENNNFSDEEKQKIESWLPNTKIYW